MHLCSSRQASDTKGCATMSKGHTTATRKQKLCRLLLQARSLGRKASHVLFQNRDLLRYREGRHLSLNIFRACKVFHDLNLCISIKQDHLGRVCWVFHLRCTCYHSLHIFVCTQVHHLYIGLHACTCSTTHLYHGSCTTTPHPRNRLPLQVCLPMGMACMVRGLT